MNRYNECDILVTELNENEHIPRQITTKLLYRDPHYIANWVAIHTLANISLLIPCTKTES